MCQGVGLTLPETLDARPRRHDMRFTAKGKRSPPHKLDASGSLTMLTSVSDNMHREVPNRGLASLIAMSEGRCCSWEKREGEVFRNQLVDDARWLFLPRLKCIVVELRSITSDQKLCLNNSDLFLWDLVKSLRQGSNHSTLHHVDTL